MLLLLPPATVPLLVAAGLVIVRLLRPRSAAAAPRCGCSSRSPTRGTPSGPALVLVIAGAPQLDLSNLPLLGAALLVRLPLRRGSATLREAAARGIAPQLQIKVLAHVVMVDACLAPIGFLAGLAATRHAAAVLLVLPLAALLMLLARDRHARIEQAQSRLQLAIRERSRLQSAVRRMGDAFAAKLDLDALVDIMLRGSIEAVDADTGCLRLDRLRAAHPARGRARGPARRPPGRGRRRDRRQRAPSRSTTTPAGRSRCPSASPRPTD